MKFLLLVTLTVLLFAQTLAEHHESEGKSEDWDEGEKNDWDENVQEHDMNKEWDDDTEEHSHDWDDESSMDDWKHEMYGSGNINTVCLPLVVSALVAAWLAFDKTE